MKRREFVQKTALASAGVLASSSLMATMAPDKIKEFGVQIYTVRDLIAKDYYGTLKALRKTGFDYCEAFGFGDGKLLGKSIKDAKAAFAKAKLPIRSIHASTGATTPNVSGTMNNDWQRAVDDAAELGAKYLVCPYLQTEERKNIDQYKRLAELMNKCGEASIKSGIQFLYHNHEFEFQELDGEIPYDIILKDTDSYLVKMELDIYWVRFADQDPLKMFRENPKRFPLWHIKDMETAATRNMTEVGKGRIDWRQLFAHAPDAGMTSFFIEQDRNWATDPIRSTATGLKHLKGLRY
jgi:sugar phosphate isomerase/epimerase